MKAILLGFAIAHVPAPGTHPMTALDVPFEMHGWQEDSLWNQESDAKLKHATARWPWSPPLQGRYMMTQLGMLILRVVVGLIFAMHGWQKFNEFTIAGTQASFRKMGVPLADIAAPVVATVELAGGIALILGVLTRVFAALLIIDMLSAMFIVHLTNGFFVANNGLEFVMVLAAACLMFALAGAGRYSVDHALFGRKRSRMNKLA